MTRPDLQRSSQEPMMVYARHCTAAADQLRSTAVGAAPVILRNGVKVNAAQLDRAAAILAEAELSVITSASGSDAKGITLGQEWERPGFIRQGATDDVMVLDVGILGSTHTIKRDGTDA